MNYYKLNSASPFTNEFVYVDLPEYLADRLFIKHMVKVKFDKDQMRRPGDPYVVVFCKVRKKDTGKFLAALDELPEKMHLHGHKDYEEYCQKVFGILKHGKEESNGSQTD